MVYRNAGQRRLKFQVVIATCAFLLIGSVLAFGGTTKGHRREPQRRALVRFVAPKHMGSSNTRPLLAKLFRGQRPPALPVHSWRREIDPDKARLTKGVLTQSVSDGSQIRYTLMPKLQRFVEHLFKSSKVPFGAFVAIDVKTGRVLALVEYSHEQPNRKGLAREAIAPAASLFKIVTSAALLEAAKLRPQTHVCYHGGRHRVTADNLRNNKRLDKACASLGDALGRSINAIFGKLAARYLSPGLLRRYAAAFGFNARLPFTLPAEAGKALIVNNRLTMANTAAGFWNTTLSPLHAALIAQAIANAGIMLRPTLIDRVTLENELLFVAKTGLLRRVVSPYTAHKLGQMMLTTTEKGTAARYFRKRRRPLRGVQIAGKTGSLSSRSMPYLHYSWFMGFAPAEKPTIAIAAFVGNRRLWRIKSTYVAREALTVYFDLKR